MNAITSKRSWSGDMEEHRDSVKSTKGKKGGSRESSHSRKKSKPNNKNDTDTKPCPPKKLLELETDPLILQRRQKQIDYGKNTVGYHNYIAQVKIDERTKDHPKTPDKFAKYSRRSWDTLIKLWRKKLHEYDTNAAFDEDDHKVPPRKLLELETDPLILQRRQKQIDCGKNTVGYHNYIAQVKIDERTKDHPKTPDKFAKYSRRSWDTLIKLWRKNLHEYDTNAAYDEDNNSDDAYSENFNNEVERILSEFD